MSDRVQDLTNHRKVAVACKNYIDKEIKASEDRILSIVARNNVDFIDHINEPTYRFTAPANAKLLMLQSIAGNSVKYAPTTASDSTTAYQKTIPSYSPSIDRASASMNILGGMSYKVNQLVANGNFESASDNKWVVSRGTLNISNNVATVTASDNSSPSFALSRVSMKESVVGHKYLVAFDIKHNIDTSKISQVEASGGWGTFVPTTPTINTKTRCIGITTGYSVASYLSIALRYNNASDMQIGVDKMEVENVQLIDLTAMGIDTSDVSVATSELLNRGIDINTYQAYDSGSIRDTAPTSVVSKDINDTTIDTLSINASIQALDGYGWGINDTCYNYIDFNAKKFIKKMARVDLGSLYVEYSLGSFRIFISNIKQTPSTNIICSPYTITSSQTWDGMSNMEIGKLSSDTQIRIINNSYSTAEAFKTAMSGVYLYYELATPVETDISAYLTTNEIEIEPNGTLSFESTYSAYVPSNVSYNAIIKHALATAVKQDGFNVWDEEWAVGTYYPNTINSKNPISLISGLTYYLKAPSDMLILFYDSNMATIGDEQRWYANATKVIPNNAKYMTFRMTSNYGTTYQNDLCINISNQDLNGTYKPHKPTITRLLPNSEAKYSWGITDGVRNTRVFCDDECNPVNEGQLDVDNQDLGIPNWAYGGGIFYTEIVGAKPATSANIKGNILCELYENVGRYFLANNMEMAIDVFAYVNIINNSYSTTSAFKTAMNGEILWYQKNATDTETLDDFDFSFDCEEGDTFTIIGCELLQCYATYSFLIKEAKSNE